MFKIIRSLATKARSARSARLFTNTSAASSTHGSPFDEPVGSFSPPRGRNPRESEEVEEGLVKGSGSGTVCEGTNRTGKLAVLDATNRSDAGGTEVLKDPATNDNVQHTQPNAVGLGITISDQVSAHNRPAHISWFQSTTDDLFDDSLDELYDEYRDRRRRLREVQHQLSLMEDRFDHDISGLREERQELRSELRRLQPLVSGTNGNSD